MRADRPNSSDNASAQHVVDEEVEKHAWTFPQEEAPRHIAYANEPSTCGEALDLLHLSTELPQEDEDFAAQTKNWAGDGGQH